MEAKPDETVLSYVDKDAQDDDDDPYMNVSILAELYETEFNTEQLPEEIQKEFNGLVAKAYTTMRENPSPENAGKLINRCHKFLDRESEAQEDLQVLDADIRRLERWIASLVYPVESIDAAPTGPDVDSEDEKEEDEILYEPVEKPDSLSDRFESVRRGSQRLHAAMKDNKNTWRVSGSATILAPKKVFDITKSDLQRPADDAVNAGGYKHFINRLEEGTQMRTFLEAGLNSIAEDLVKKQRRANGNFDDEVSHESEEFLAQMELINAVPLPSTVKQMALAGCLLSMDNFLLCKGKGKGAFAHV
ncbi:MAG: hypothetical protein SGARI_005996, partial [Bacillariaceae sp.]